MAEPSSAAATLLLGPFPDMDRLRLILLARGALLEIADPAEAARRLRAEPVGLWVLSKAVSGAGGAASLARRLRFDRRAASRWTDILVLGPSFAPWERVAIRDAGATLAAAWPAPDDALLQALASIEADRRLWIDGPAYCGPCRRSERSSVLPFAERRAGGAGRGQRPAMPAG